MNDTDRTIVAKGDLQTVRTYIDEALGDPWGDDRMDGIILDRMWDALWDAGHIDRNPGGENVGYVLYLVPEDEWMNLYLDAAEGI
jgi:hypothetical protein